MVMSRHIFKLIKTRFVLCCDRANNVGTSNVMFKFTYVATMRNIVATETFLAISESKVHYVVAQSKCVATQKFDAQVNLYRDLQKKNCRDNVFLPTTRVIYNCVATQINCVSADFPATLKRLN